MTGDAVLDTNVLISATLFPNSLAQKLFERLVRSGWEIICSEEMLLEYESRIRRDFPEQEARLPLLIENLRLLAVIVAPVKNITACRDPQDNKILGCAVAASAKYLVSYDKDLLDLKKFEGIRILHPKDMVKMLG